MKLRIVSSLIISLAVGNISTAKSLKVVKDPALEKRLKVIKTYTTRKNDTLKKVAYRLYGHKSWWKKLKKYNKNLRKLKPDKKIRTGLKIKYLAPEIKLKYIVQKGDTLSRIAQWKFGNLETWPKLFKYNSRNLTHPNLIHPNEVLFLTEQGKIIKQSTGEVLIDPPKTSDNIKNKAIENIKQIKNFKFTKKILTIISLSALILIIVIYSILKLLTLKSRHKQPGFKVSRNQKHLVDNYTVDKSMIQPEAFSFTQRRIYHGILKLNWWKKYLRIAISSRRK